MKAIPEGGSFTDEPTSKSPLTGPMVGVFCQGIMDRDGQLWTQRGETREAVVYIYGRVSVTTDESARRLTPAHYEKLVDEQLMRLKADIMGYMTPRLKGETPWDVYGSGGVPNGFVDDPSLLGNE